MSRRLFVAAWLPPGAREEATGVLERLKGVGADVRWVPPENLHVTLRFLGDVSEERIDVLSTCLKQELTPMGPALVRLGGLGAFPPRGTPRVVWVGFEDGASEIALLASAAGRAVVDAGVLSESEKRPFRAHVTLGRPRRPRGLARLVELLGELSFSSRTHLLEEVILAESRLSPRGATYHPVVRVPLGGSAPKHSNSH